ncbi:BON domain-containing protein [Bremerella cremea]|uniref:Transport-associated domain protein n=1 Tax=Blastopirellula marina TaxID=124 RepID=A0A2S8FVF9_9BACT|nr:MULTISPECIES: BON domain-containing protein [Pirellulaceae]PQO36165.1 transport-associated domain protein [Blastopirellula marina]RCS48842.1 BON domain-containing protein [Bremerella cremea]
MISSSKKDIRSRVVTALEESSIRRLRFIKVEFQDNTLCLRGEVRSFYHKQLLQELVRSIDGNVQVRNDVTVEA